MNLFAADEDSYTSQANDSALSVLIIDDSAVMRTLLKTVVGSDSRIKSVLTAPDGPTALAMIEEALPSVILLDIEMPEMDGLAVLQTIRARHRNLPVIMCSTVTRRGASITLDALAAGASDYVPKPSARKGVSEAIAALKRDLLPRIFALCQSPSHSQKPAESEHRPTPPTSLRRIPKAEMIAIAVSTGGPPALDRVLPALPSDFPLPVVVVQHMPALFTSHLAERLNSRCLLPVKEAEPGAPLMQGAIWIARGDWHLELVPVPAPVQAGPRFSIHLTQTPKNNLCRPSADILFHSASRCFGAGTVAVVMTGMGSDGLEGSRAIRAAGGTVIAQNQETSAVWGMPGAVAKAGLANKVLPLDLLAPEIIRLVTTGQRAE